MKTLLAILLGISCNIAKAQLDTLDSKNYRLADATVTKQKNGESHLVLNGSTKDVRHLEIHTTTLMPDKVKPGAETFNNREELILIKEGTASITINGTSTLVGPGSLALFEPGDNLSIANGGATPMTYYVLSYTGQTPIDIQRGKQAGGSFVKDWQALEVKQTDKGQSRPIYDRPTAVFPRFDVHATALNPGISSHAPHTHRAEEIILMIKGRGEMQIGDQFHKAVAGDVILVNANVPHAFTNTGNVQCGYYAIQWHHM